MLGFLLALFLYHCSVAEPTHNIWHFEKRENYLRTVVIMGVEQENQKLDKSVSYSDSGDHRGRGWDTGEEKLEGGGESNEARMLR